MLYPKTAQIILDYFEKDPSNIIHLRRCLQKDMKTVQVVYSRYFLIDKRGIDLKDEFLLSFKTWEDKKIFNISGKQCEECPKPINEPQKDKQDQKS